MTVDEMRAAPQLPGLGAATLPEAFAASAARDPEAVALRTVGETAGVTWAQYAARVERLAAGLHALGVRRGDTVAFMLANTPEHLMLDTAALHLGATPFSIYLTSAPGQIAYLLGNAGARLVVAEVDLAERVRAADVPGLEHVLTVDDLPALEARGEPGFDLAAHAAEVRPDDVATIIYTSGTTGPPKGVEITHANLLWEWAAVHAALPVRPGGRVLSYLPLAHMADRFASHYCQLVTGATVTCVRDPREVGAALADGRPTVFAGVPRIWEKLHAALEAKLGPEPPPAAGPAVLAQLGFDDVDWVGSGAAPIAASTLAFFERLGLPISEVWGMSEVSCIGTVNPLDDIRPGTVGRALPGVELRLEEDGELLVRGPNVMRGYRGDPERTAEAMAPGGWLRTGDVATIDEDGYVRIVDRKKELIINSAGKNMSPANIENGLKSASGLIGQACCIGDRRPYNVALLVLDPDMAGEWAARHGRDDASAAALASDPDLLAEIGEAVERANAQLSRVEQIKRFTVLPVDWLPDSDELTPTAKLKRRVIVEKYAEEIEALYAGESAR